MSKSKGRYWQIHSDGYLINDARPNHIEGPVYNTCLKEVVHAYTQNALNAVHSIYISGTLARGLTLPGQTDLEVFAIYDPKIEPEAQDESWLPNTEDSLRAKYNQLIPDITLDTWAYAYVFEEPGYFSAGAFTIKTQSLCIWGNDLTTHLPDYNFQNSQIRIAIANEDIIDLREDIEDTRNAINDDPSAENIQYWSKIIGKRLLYAGLALVMVDSGHYTNDLDLCYEQFALKYPAKAEEMRHTWDLVVKPAQKPDALLNLLDGFGTWMLDKTDQWLDYHNPERDIPYCYDPTYA